MSSRGEKREQIDRAKLRCPPELTLRFFREMSIMLGAGVPLGQALDALASFATEPRMAWVVSDLHRMVTTGHTLSSALRVYPRVFSGVSVAMIALGETTGQLTESAQRLACWMERDQDVRKRVGSALVYPAFSLALTVTLTLMLFVFVVPDFLSMLTGMGAKIPAMTMFLVLVTGFLTSPWGWLLIALGAVCLYFTAVAILTTPAGKVTVLRVIMDVPVLGTLLQASAFARYAAAAETMSQCGTDLFTTARLSALASGNFLLQADVKALNQSLGQGETLSSHMATRPDLYPSSVTYFVAAGEESARMTEMFAFIREYYDEEVNHGLKVMTSLMEPLIMALLALIVGFVIIALLLPMHNFISNLN
jgi:type II secretory pathway component PulF